MKKTAYIILGALLLVSCSKDYYDEWSGTHSSGELAGCDYMYCVANYLIVDNIKQLETALLVDANTTGSTSTRFDRSGAIRTIGSKWTVTDRSSVLEGLLIERVAADSTWTLTRKGKYPFSYSSYSTEHNNNFDTDYEMEVRMLKDTSSVSSPDHYWWQVSLKKCTRTEENGYKAELFTSETAPLKYTYGSFCSWAYCEGVLNMQVYKDDSIIDVARLQLTGSMYDNSYIRNL